MWVTKQIVEVEPLNNTSDVGKPGGRKNDGVQTSFTTEQERPQTKNIYTKRNQCPLLLEGLNN